MLRSPKAWLTLMLINVTRPPFTDVRVRRALAMAVDRKEVRRRCRPGTSSSPGLPYNERNEEKAKRLLREAAYKGEPIRVKRRNDPKGYHVFATGTPLFYDPTHADFSRRS